MNVKLDAWWDNGKSLTNYGINTSNLKNTRYGEQSHTNL